MDVILFLNESHSLGDLCMGQQEGELLSPNPTGHALFIPPLPTPDFPLCRCQDWEL